MKPRRSLSGTISVVAVTPGLWHLGSHRSSHSSIACNWIENTLSKDSSSQLRTRALWVRNDDRKTAATGKCGRMYEAYFTKRLLEALTRADEAADAGERSVHLQTSRYYRDLLEFTEKRGAVRHPIHLCATVRYGSQWKRAIVTDLSTGGFRIVLGDQVCAAAPLELQMDGFAPLDGFVVWQDGDQVGCRFKRRIHPALVDAGIALGSPT